MYNDTSPLWILSFKYLDMTVFINLLIACSPLLLLLVIWYISARKLGIQTKDMSNVLMYVIMPFVVFDGIYKVELSAENMFLPVLIFIFACIICLLWYRVGKFFWQDTKSNLVALSAGKGNYLYFWLPLAIFLLGDSSSPLWILMTMGFILYENTLGMYITAKGRFSTLESIIKVIKMPSIWAFIAGILVQMSWRKLPDIYTTNIVYFKWAMIILWTMLIGVALASIKKLHIDRKFLITTHVLKFIVRPSLFLWLIYLDITYFHIYNTLVYNILFIVSLVPLGVNNIAIATIFDINTDDIAVAILISTVFALLYIPLMVAIFGGML